MIGFASGEIPALPVNLPLLKGAALVGVDYRQFAAVYEAAAAQRELDELLAWVAEAGSIRRRAVPSRSTSTARRSPTP